MMKKMLLASALLCAALGAVSAQEGAGASGGTVDVSRYGNVGLLNVGTYSAQFISEASNSVGSSFTINAKKANRDEANRIAALSGDSGLFDTAEEIALLSATAGVINIRPVEAADMLPAGDPALVDLQLGAMLYMKKVAVSFLGGGA
jgi:hypothetical protein